MERATERQRDSNKKNTRRERQTERQRDWWGVGATEERFERAARRVRQSARNPAGMRFSSSCCLLLLGLVLQAAAFVDEDNDAIVIEGMTTQQLASSPLFKGAVRADYRSALKVVLLKRSWVGHPFFCFLFCILYVQS
jgi:hypothetical protein